MTTPTSTTTPQSPSLSASTITKSTFDALLLRYDALITHLSASTSTSTSTSTKPSTPSLQTLDRLRYHTIPQRLAARKKAAETSHDPGNGAYLEKEEVEDLVRWKLYVAYRSTALGLWPCPPPPHGE